MPKLSYEQLDELATALRDLRAGVEHFAAEVSTMYPDNYREPPTFEDLAGVALSLTRYVNSVRVAVATLPKEA